MSSQRISLTNIFKSKAAVAIASSFVTFAILAGVSIAFAQAGGTIRACVKDDKLKSIGTAVTCAPNETVLEWNIMGAPGPSGPPGPPGEAGGGGVFATVGSYGGGVSSCSSFYGPSGSCQPDREVPLPRDGKLASLAINPYDNTRATTANFTVLVNGINTALQIQVPPGSTSVQVINADVSVQAGDLVVLQGTGVAEDNSGTVSMTATVLYQTD